MALTPYIGDIMMVAFDFAPKNWALCNGQLLAIASNPALFSLLGTFYGGNGVTTFGLPDLRGRVPIHSGQGPGLSNYVLSQKGGVETATLTVNQLPTHTHALSISTLDGSETTPVNNVLAVGGHYTTAAPNAGMTGTGNLPNAGGSQPFSLTKPSLCINWIIATNGLFPSRN